MRATKPTLLLAAALTSFGCWQIKDIDDAGQKCPASDLSASPIDMATAAPKCAAAKGLPGDNVLCVDFDKITQLSDPALAGWNFNANMTGCWQISGGYLQVQSFATFSGNCGLTLPPIDFRQSDKQNYQKATLSLMHRVDMNDIDQQYAQVFLESFTANRLVHAWTGRPGIPSAMAASVTINKSDLPSALMSVYKFFLNASSGSSISGRSGWQIQSIAVNISP